MGLLDRIGQWNLRHAEGPVSELPEPEANAPAGEGSDDGDVSAVEGASFTAEVLSGGAEGGVAGMALALAVLAFSGLAVLFAWRKDRAAR